MAISSDYERRARLQPGLLMVAPIGISAIALGIEYTSAIATIGGILVSAGAPFLLMDFVRSRGLALQEKLYTSWGGPPTTQLLRLSASTNNEEKRTFWRQQLSSRSGVALPTSEDERQDAKGADKTYEILTTWAREATRKDSLLFDENRAYGFHRNLFAVRSLGLWSSSISLFVLIIATGVPGLTAALLAGILANAILCIVWFSYPDERRVSAAAYRYARQLFDSATS